MGSHQIAVVMFGLILLGLGWSAATVGGSALLNDAAPATERVRLQGRSDLAMNLAGALGGAVSGLLLALLGYAGLAWTLLLPITVVLTVGSVGVRRSRARAASELSDPYPDLALGVIVPFYRCGMHPEVVAGGRFTVAVRLVPEPVQRLALSEVRYLDAGVEELPRGRLHNAGQVRAHPLEQYAAVRGHSTIAASISLSESSARSGRREDDHRLRPAAAGSRAPGRAPRKCRVAVSVSPRALATRARPRSDHAVAASS